MKYSGIQIQSTTPAAKHEENAVDALLGCHDRIRYFTELSERLASAVGQPQDDIAMAAQSVHRYFTVALPLHEADENNSVDPRVRAAVPETRLADASAEMVRQHKDINALLRELIPMWSAVADNPARLAELARDLRDRSQRLRELFEGHLSLEEQTVFPAMREYLSTVEMAMIQAEMRERRK